MKILAAATLVASLSITGAMSITGALAGGDPFTDYSPTSSWSGTFIGVTGGAILGGDHGGSDLDATGYLGAELGYQMQNGQFVYGGVVDYGITKFDAATDYDAVGLGTARFKLGVPIQENFLVYGTAGIATAHSWDNDFSGLELGLAAGVGADYKLSSDTVIGAEYVYTHFGDIGGQDLDAHSVRFKWEYFMPN